jgi:hypothetical protein
MSRKFFFSFVALVVLLSMVLASCGMPTPDVVTEEPPVETEEPATPEPTEEVTPEPTEEPVALEQGNWDPDNWATMQEFITPMGRRIRSPRLTGTTLVSSTTLARRRSGTRCSI